MTEQTMTDRDKCRAILDPASMAKRTPSGADFAQEIAEKFGRDLDRGRVLSVRQSGLLDRLLAEVEPKAIAEVGASFDAVKALFDKASASGLKRPALRVTVDGIGLALSPAKATGRNPGALYVRADGAYAGKIADGSWRALMETSPAVTAAVVALAADPVAMAVQSGKLTGACSFCRLALSDPRSVEAGYGAICASKWGLPWGGPVGDAPDGATAGQKAAATRKARQAASAEPAQVQAEPEALTPGQKAARTRKLRQGLQEVSAKRVRSVMAKAGGY